MYNKPLLNKGLASKTRPGTLMPAKLTTGITPFVLQEKTAAERGIGLLLSVMFAEECPFKNTSAMGVLFPNQQKRFRFKLGSTSINCDRTCASSTQELTSILSVKPSFPKNDQQGLKVSQYQNYVAC